MKILGKITSQVENYKNFLIIIQLILSSISLGVFGGFNLFC